MCLLLHQELPAKLNSTSQIHWNGIHTDGSTRREFQWETFRKSKKITVMVLLVRVRIVHIYHSVLADTGALASSLPMYNWARSLQKWFDGLSGAFRKEAKGLWAPTIPPCSRGPCPKEQTLNGRRGRR